MDKYITGAIIKHLREEKRMTQAELAQKLNVSDKTVSKWETGKGYPDITLMEPIAKAMGISIIELLSGNNVTNKNTSANMLRSKFYVCPICGNVIVGTGEAVISCCGVVLPVSESEPAGKSHTINLEAVEDEYYITVDHEMTKSHYISFIAGVSDAGIEITKLYPEGNAEARIKRNRIRKIYCYCNRDGLFELRP